MLTNNVSQPLKARKNYSGYLLVGWRRIKMFEGNFKVCFVDASVYRCSIPRPCVRALINSPVEYRGFGSFLYIPVRIGNGN